MRNISLLFAVAATAACLSASSETFAANVSTAGGSAIIAPAQNVQLVHTHPFKHCHSCAGRNRYICHTVGPTPLCPPSGRVYRPPRRPQ